MKTKFKITTLLVASLLLISVVSCNNYSEVGTVNPDNYSIIDRITGDIYHPDLNPLPQIEGDRITFTQDGKAYILNGGWLIQGELEK